MLCLIGLNRNSSDPTVVGFSYTTHNQAAVLAGLAVFLWQSPNRGLNGLFSEMIKKTEMRLKL